MTGRESDQLVDLREEGRYRRERLELYSGRDRSARAQ
jgi:hypothetical protein